MWEPGAMCWSAAKPVTNIRAFWSKATSKRERVIRLVTDFSPLPVTPSFAYSSERKLAPKPLASRVFFAPWRQTVWYQRERGARWCWHLIYIAWPGRGDWVLYACNRLYTARSQGASPSYEGREQSRGEDRYKFKLVGTCQHRAVSSSHPVMLSM